MKRTIVPTPGAAVVHTHAEADVTNLTADLALKAPLASPAFTGTPTGITKAHVGLGNVDNTSDVNKPISTATQTALDAKLAKPSNPAATSAVTVAANGTVGTSSLSEILASSAPTISPGVVNTTTETAIASLTVTAGQVVAGDMVVLDVTWDVRNNSAGSVNYTYRFKVGAVTIATAGAVALGANANRASAKGRFYVLLPTLSTPRVWGGYEASAQVGSGFGGITTAHSGVLAPATPSVDFASDVTIQLTCQMGTADAAADFRPAGAVITRIRA